MARTTAVLLAVLVLAAAGSVEAKIAIRRHNSSSDTFYFHANYSSVPFSPSDGFGLQIWNCANGEIPQFLSDRTPLVVCDYDAVIGYVLADLVYEVALPGGVCNDHGSSCYYRDRTVPLEHDGIRYLRVRYARNGRGNRVWLQSRGDLSLATQANMLILIQINGGPRAVLQDTFIPLPNGGWLSRF